MKYRIVMLKERLGWNPFSDKIMPDQDSYVVEVFKPYNYLFRILCKLFLMRSIDGRWVSVYRNQGVPIFGASRRFNSIEHAESYIRFLCSNPKGIEKVIVNEYDDNGWEIAKGENNGK